MRELKLRLKRVILNHPNTRFIFSTQFQQLRTLKKSKILLTTDIHMELMETCLRQKLKICQWNGLDISIPDSTFSNLYEHNMCSDYLAVEAYIFKIKKLFIYVNTSDGAGEYSVKFVFDKEKYLIRIVTTNEMTNGYDFFDGTAKYEN